MLVLGGTYFKIGKKIAQHQDSLKNKLLDKVEEANFIYYEVKEIHKGAITNIRQSFDNYDETGGERNDN